MAPRTVDGDDSTSQPPRKPARSVTTQSKPIKKEKQPSGKESNVYRSATTGTSPQIQPLGSYPQDEAARRWAEHQNRYQVFLSAAEQRRLQRRELHTRNKVWREARDKSQARVEALEQEHAALLHKIETMEAARERYNAQNTIHVSADEDEATRAKWEAYLNLETDTLKV